MKHRIGRVEGEILRELTKILRKDIRDPRLSDVTITAVECTNDLSYAKIGRASCRERVCLYV